MSDTRDWSQADIDRITEIRELRPATTWDEIGTLFGATGEAARSAYRRHMDDDNHTNDTIDFRQVFQDIEWPEEVDWREWFASAEEQLELIKREDPITEYVTVDLSHINEPIAVALAGDIHIGGGFTNYAAARKTIEFILETQGMKLGINGDAIEGFIPGNKTAETTEQQPLPLKAQVSAYRSLVNELSDANKLLFCTWGDHDGKWIEQEIGFNPIKAIINNKVPYFTGRGVITLKLGTEIYYICVNHSERFASQWNKVHPSRRQYERFFPADVNVTSHRHKPAFQMDHHYDELREAGINLGGKHWMVVTGTFKTGPDPYTIRSWNKGVLGVPTVIFNPDTHDTICVESPWIAKKLMDGLRRDEVER